MNANQMFLAELAAKMDQRLFRPGLYRYLADFLEIEKVRRYNDQVVLNTFIPPFPGPAFDRFVAAFFGTEQKTTIQSVDLALTNGCVFNCWHCYNAGWRLDDLPTAALIDLVEKLQDLGAIVINFTGGEPCLRPDLVDICTAVRPDSCGILATTGYGFDEQTARRLRDTGVYSVSISLDSADEAEHDARRGVRGAFTIALQGITTAKQQGFYTYTCAVPSRKLLREDNFRRLVELNEALGVDELQLIEPAPAGKIVAANLDFGQEEFDRILAYMKTYNRRETGTVITSFAHMEAPEFFGCGAGFSHIYIDGSGEVSPCNMIPVTYGNATKDDLRETIDRMQADIKHPCRYCIAYELQSFFNKHTRKMRPVPQKDIPPLPLREDDELPGFFRLLAEAESATTGTGEITAGYNEASATYDNYWLAVAADPIDELFERLEITPGAWAVDCGCGTGYATIKLAELVGNEGRVDAIDLSPGMIAKARHRLNQHGLAKVSFIEGNVSAALERMPPASVDVAVLTWLIGYVGCEEIFPLLRHVLKPGGAVGFVAHLDRSPRVPIEVFEDIVRAEPQAIDKAVILKFPRDERETGAHLTAAGLEPRHLLRGTFTVNCPGGRGVYDHVMKSGAGTTFYYALKPAARERLGQEFIRRIDDRYENSPEIPIDHEYVLGIAVAAEDTTSSLSTQE